MTECLDSHLDVASIVGTWSVAFTRARAEKVFAESLAELGIPHYLPLTARVVLRRGKKLSVSEPTFRSYCFLACQQTPGTEASYDEMYSIRGIRSFVHLIPVRDQKLFVSELTQIQKALAVDPTLSSISRLNPGTRVKVVKGPYMGCEGRYGGRKGDMLSLWLSIMGTSVELHIPDPSFLEEIV